MTKTTLGFEGVVGYGELTAPISSYKSFDFTNFGIINKYWPFEHGYGNGNGIYAMTQHTASGMTQETRPGHSDGFISSDTNFTLQSGLFASSWLHDGEDVKFIAWRDGVIVGRFTVHLDETPTLIQFHHNFENIDQVEIKATSPVGTDSNVSIDQLRIDLLDEGRAPAAAQHHPSPAEIVADHMASEHHVAQHAGDWLA